MIDQITPQTLAILIFIVTYFFIATGLRERAIASVAGAAAVWALGILDGKEILGYVNFDAIILIFGMMVVVGGLKESGFFRWVGIHLANLCNCNPTRMLLVFASMTALLSAFLDNVTTVLFMVIVTIDIMRTLKMNPIPYVIVEMLASNIGGTATLVGDPPNIMIATAGGLTFMDFIFNTAPITLVSFIPACSILYHYYRRDMERTSEYNKIPLKPSEVIVDQRLFRIGIVIFSITIGLFFVHDKLHMSPSTIAILGAIIFLFLGGPKMPEVLTDVEWSTLIFFAALFVIIGGLEKTGLIHELSTLILMIVGANEFLAISAILWSTSLSSAFVDNIPITVAFIPLIKNFSASAGFDIRALWWALSLGAGFGGNGTLIASSANIVAAGIALKEGYDIKFMDFLKIGMIILMVATAIANALLLLRMVMGI